MREVKEVRVAVLLPTYNGARFVEQQIRSLANNETTFTLHWLDDHSTDNTREIVRSVATRANIPLKEWHQSQHLGVPDAFFQLLECVESDIYLFCDQDDVWQPGKVDATVANLLPDLDFPVICFSDPMAFRGDDVQKAYRMLDILRSSLDVAMQESRVFMCVVGYGHTEGFTRALREIFMRHKEIARRYALMHDMWMYAIAVASGTARILTDAPTTLYRWHQSNSSSQFNGWVGDGAGHMEMTWRQHQELRRGVSRHAKGFILASPTLPRGPKLERLLEIAHLLTELHRRRSLVTLIRLARRRVMWASTRLMLGLAAVCLLSDAGN